MDDVVRPVKLDVQNMVALTVGVAKSASALGAVLADGTVDMKDLPQVPKLFAALREFSHVDFNTLLPEADDLDEAERIELHAVFVQYFDLPNDNIEAAIEQGYEILMMALQAIMMMVEVSNRVKTPLA